MLKSIWNWFGKRNNDSKIERSDKHENLNPKERSSCGFLIQVLPNGDFNFKAFWPKVIDIKQRDLIISHMATLIWSLSKGRFLDHLRTSVDNYGVLANLPEAPEIQDLIETWVEMEDAPIVRPTAVFKSKREEN